MRIRVIDLQAGDILIADAFNDNGLHILSSHTFINADDIALLNQHHIEYVEIQARHTDQAEPQIAVATELTDNMRKTLPTYNEAVDGVREMFAQVLTEGKISEEQVQQSFDPLVENFQKEKDVVGLLVALNSKDDYTYQHSVQVGMLSHYIATWLNYSQEDILLAGKAGYLHDIGKAKIDESILKKPGRLSEEEYNLIKQHTLLGYEIIRRSMGEGVFALAALQHHERLDGKGYPQQLRETKIHPISKIVAVADVYSAMISTRVYRRKHNLLAVLKELYRMSFGELDPFIVNTFIKNMIPNFIGKKILLTSGETGTIVYNNPTDFFHPLIQIGKQFIDLSKETVLEIEKIYI